MRQKTIEKDVENLRVFLCNNHNNIRESNKMGQSNVKVKKK